MMSSCLSEHHVLWQHPGHPALHVPHILYILHCVSAAGWWSWPLNTTWGTCRQVTARSCWWSWGRVCSRTALSRTGAVTSSAGATETLKGPKTPTVSPAPSSVLSNETQSLRRRRHTQLSLYSLIWDLVLYMSLVSCVIWIDWKH